MTTKIAPTLTRALLAFGAENDAETLRAERQLRALRAVARAGCARHPTYRALRRPTAVCPSCNALWSLSRASRPRKGKTT